MPPAPVEQDRILRAAHDNRWVLDSPDSRTLTFRKGDHVITVTFGAGGVIQRASIDSGTVQRSRLAAVIEAMRKLS